MLLWWLLLISPITSVLSKLRGRSPIILVVTNDAGTVLVQDWILANLNVPIESGTIHLPFPYKIVSKVT
jgi:hypothetical protein